MADALRFTNSEEANKLINPPYREGWRLLLVVCSLLVKLLYRKLAVHGGSAVGLRA